MTGRLSALWRQMASCYGGKAYLRRGDRVVSYAQAAKAIGRFAGLIRSRGWASRTTPLAINIEDPLKLALVIGASVELDVGLAFLPDCRRAAVMRSLLAETGAKLLLTDSGDFADCPWAVSTRELEDAPLAEDQMVGVPEAVRGAFILQTSGTTGESKWVACGYDQCLAAIEGMAASGALGHARDQAVYLTAPLSHSYGLSTLLEYSYCGSTIVFPSGGSSLGPVGELLGKGGRDEITAIEGVPFFYGQFCRLVTRMSLPALGHLGIGAGALPPALLEATRTRWPDLSYSLRYGLTETPSAVSHKVFTAMGPQNLEGSGRVTGAYDVRIVDDDGHALPPGREGEIVVRGDSLASYLGAAPSGELRTGDRGFLDKAGELHVIGRSSAFLKNRGFRISPDRVEAMAMALPGVAEARVSMRGEKLVAEIVTSGGDLEARSLLQQLAECLPAYCLPDKLIQVASIPRTRSGKVRRA